MPHGNPGGIFLRQNGCFRHLQKVLDAEDAGANHNDTAKGFGEQIAIILQVREDLHASEDSGNIMMSINGCISPNPCQDQQPGKGEENADKNAEKTIVAGDAPHFLLSHVRDPHLHGLLPGVAFHHTDAEENFTQSGDALVHALLCEESSVRFSVQNVQTVTNTLKRCRIIYIQIDSLQDSRVVFSQP